MALCSDSNHRGGGNRAGPKVRLGAVATACIFFPFFCVLRLSVCAEQREVALPFSLPVVASLLLALGALPLPLPLLVQAVGGFVASSLQVVGCFDVVWHRFVTRVLAASFVHLPRFLLRGE